MKKDDQEAVNIAKFNSKSPDKQISQPDENR